MEQKDQLLSLCKAVVDVLETKASGGKHNPAPWEGYENCNGTEVGKDIDRLIRRCKRIIKQQSKS